MRDGFIAVATGCPEIRVADCTFNAQKIISIIKEADCAGIKLLCLPELCLTGYTCADLFLCDTLIRAAEIQLQVIINATAQTDVLTMIGYPFSHRGRLYNCVAVIKSGTLLALIGKRNLPDYAVYYESRYFSPAPKHAETVRHCGFELPFGSDILLENTEIPAFRVAAEICEDLWVPNSPSISHAMAGANIICNSSASDETIGKASNRRNLVQTQSSKLLCAYLYANCGDNESSQDVVYSGHSLITEAGNLLAESKKYTTGIMRTEIDLTLLENERRKKNSFSKCDSAEGYTTIYFDCKIEQTRLTRRIDSAPFVPNDNEERTIRCAEILDIQTRGLARRLRHIGAKTVVLGISGGLDSTLALLVVARAFKLTNLDPKGIYAVTMPCFGTTKRTRGNAEILSECMGATFIEIPIGQAVEQHFRDIGQDPECHDVTYENSQARERTQVLMDLANKVNGLVVGTGDLSELALGWATFNGDHMSMYGVNCSVPKTLVRHLVKYEAETAETEELQKVLLDILDTPVSPELLPPTGDGEIAQVTEDLVGPYALHDFFLYYTVRRGYTPSKIFRLAKIAFDGVYSPETIEKWLIVFIRRFFSMQFKRNCLPDGPKVGTVSLSPRSDWRMPSDAWKNEWKL